MFLFIFLLFTHQLMLPLAQSDGALNSLRAELKKLETELLDSYEIIDELEFEVEQVNGDTTILII